MILVIDNYDSFTFNLVQLVGKLHGDLMVRRNDAVTVDEIARLKPTGILLSPGPGRPEAAGVMVDVIRGCGATIPILGVCLGHQAIGYAFGGTIKHAPQLMHGRTSSIQHLQNSPLYDGVPSPFVATRYHSLVIGEESFPEALEITAQTDDGVIMGVRHRSFPIEGVQFHPESILTEVGERIVKNWLKAQQC